MLSDKKLLTRAHQELCLSTHALFLEAYGDDELAHGQYQEWQRGFQATVKNKRISEREERDKIASVLLPLQVKAYVIVRLAERCNVH
jgi:hypothetical protein